MYISSEAGPVFDGKLGHSSSTPKRSKFEDRAFRPPTQGRKQSAEMSIAPTIPVIKVKLYPSPSALLSKVPQKPSFAVRCSKAEGPLRRPAAPSLSPPPTSVVPSLSPPPSLSDTPPVKPEAPTLQSPVVARTVGEVKGVVTLEYQRRMAKELQEYFRQKKMEEADQGPFFGFMGKNEITNGRWAMFGFAVGLLTEYATGSDFVQQLKILFSNFGIVDLD